MFFQAESFQGDISQWDTSSCTSMRSVRNHLFFILCGLSSVLGDPLGSYGAKLRGFIPFLLTDVCRMPSIERESSVEHS